MPLDFEALTAEATPESIKAEMAARLQENGLDVDMREGSYTDLLFSEAAYQIYKGLSYHPTLLAAAVPSPESGPWLDKFGDMFGVSRTPAATAHVTVTFTGDDGTTIPAGTVVVSTGGLRFATEWEAVITDGSAEVSAAAEEAGASYNVAAGTLTRLSVSLGGVNGVTNAAPGEGGADAESDASYYERIHTFLSEPVASGNVNHYKQWARSVSGVGNAAVIPLWDGNGTVKVVVASEDNEPVDEAIVTAAAQYIESVRPIGADVTVVSATALTVNIAATCTLEGGVLASAVQAELESRVAQMFLEMEMGAAEPVRYNRVMVALLSCDGVVDCSALTLNGGTTNLAVTVEQVPALGTVTITPASGG
mgnify:FL=1